MEFELKIEKGKDRGIPVVWYKLNEIPVEYDPSLSDRVEMESSMRHAMKVALLYHKPWEFSYPFVHTDLKVPELASAVAEYRDQEKLGDVVVADSLSKPTYEGLACDLICYLNLLKKLKPEDSLMEDGHLQVILGNKSSHALGLRFWRSIPEIYNGEDSWIKEKPDPFELEINKYLGKKWMPHGSLRKTIPHGDWEFAISYIFFDGREFYSPRSFKKREPRESEVEFLSKISKYGSSN